MSKSKASDAKERSWRKAIVDQSQSGLSVRAFCRMRQVNESSFYYWRKHIRQPDRNDADKQLTPPAFAPVVVIDEPAAAIEIVLGDGCTVRVPPHATHEQLDMVLAALESGRC
jgi:hypothetical protein